MLTNIILFSVTFSKWGKKFVGYLNDNIKWDWYFSFGSEEERSIEKIK